MPQRPNILVFCVDEMRADHMHCAGNELIRTPTLDALAARGTLFRQARCNNPICMPARATLFTGLLPRDHGLRVNGQPLRTDLPTLPGVLASAGYRTHSAGKLHLTPWIPKLPEPDLARCPEDRAAWTGRRGQAFPVPYYGLQSVDFVGGHTSYAWGQYLDWLIDRGGSPEDLTRERALDEEITAPGCYRMRLPEELHYNRYIADSTIALIDECADADRPFFAWCSFPDPHAPVAPPEPYCHRYRPQDVPLPARREGELDDLPPVYRRILEGTLHPNGSDNTGITDRHWREMIALTWGMIGHVDTEMARVMDALARRGLEENTVVVFVSDHGDMMGDHGLIWKSFYTFGGVTRIPLIIAAPGMARGKVSEALASQIDLMPTLLDLAGVPMPGADWVDRETPFERGAVIPLEPYPGRSMRGVLDGSTECAHEATVIENDDPTTGYRVRCLATGRHRLTVYPGADDGELFDLQADPDELHNLWYREQHQGLRARLVEQLLSHYSTQTPLYPVPPWNS